MINYAAAVDRTRNHWLVDSMVCTGRLFYVAIYTGDFLQARVTDYNVLIVDDDTSVAFKLMGQVIA